LPNRNKGNKAKYYIITGECFKKLCARCDSIKGDQVLNYFMKIEKLAQLYTKYLYEIQNQQHQIQLKQKDLELKQNKLEIDTIKKSLNYCQNELNDFKKLKNKGEFIYIMTTKTYLVEGLFKIGKSVNTNKRLASLNSSHPINDQLKIIKEFEVYDNKIAEDRIKHILQNIRDTKNREFFKCVYYYLEKIVKLICDNLYDECEEINFTVNMLLDMNKYDVLDWKKGLPDLTIFETEKILISKNKETEDIKINENITNEELENILLKILKTKKGFKTINSFDDALNKINKYKYINKDEILNSQFYMYHLNIKQFIKDHNKFRYKE
jgi:hypothetical protein